MVYSKSTYVNDTSDDPKNLEVEENSLVFLENGDEREISNGDNNIFDNSKESNLYMEFLKYDSYNSKEDKTNIGKIRLVDVFNPLEFIEDTTLMIKSNATKGKEIVDHQTSSSSNYNLVFESGALFEITPKYKNATKGGYNNLSTEQYSKGYFLKFDFDVKFERLKNGDRPSFYSKDDSAQEDWDKNNIIKSGSVIYIEGGSNTFYGYPSGYLESNSTISQLKNNVEMVCVSNNSTSKIRTHIKDKLLENKNEFDFGIINNLISLAYDKKTDQGDFFADDLEAKGSFYYSSKHAIKTTFSTTNLNRIFGFTVTDCTDIAWKDIFRESDSSMVNKSTGTQYYSGIFQWDLSFINNGILYNNSKIISDRIYTLPVGPYRNKIDDNSTYIYAPKLGYRISYNVKTTGKVESDKLKNKYVEITPSYYYISKDGKTFIDNVNLYYKNSNGKYVNFENSGYSIYYKPDDGYRYLNESGDNDNVYTSWEAAENITNLSNKLIKIDISKPFQIRSNSATLSNGGFMQAWFGEFKLPNSTIVVDKSDDSINNPLKDGYIGVKFDIICKYQEDDGSIKTISYNVDNNATSSKYNTTQWDYEGYLGFTNPGNKKVNLTVQLEKGDWNITSLDQYKGENDIYNKIKGTVILYDTDARAANDFN